MGFRKLPSISPFVSVVLFYITFFAARSRIQDPTRPYTTWAVTEIREWLHVRGLSNKGKKKDLMNVLHNIMLSAHVPRPLPPKGGHISNVLELTKALAVVVGYIMQRSVNDSTIVKATYHVKLFLSCYHAVDKNLLKEGENPGWLTSYIFLCLLNVP